jgi:hypothetical protein
VGRPLGGRRVRSDGQGDGGGLRVGIAVGGRGGSAVAGAVDGGTVGKREVALLVLNSKVHFGFGFGG